MKTFMVSGIFNILHNFFSYYVKTALVSESTKEFPTLRENPINYESFVMHYISYIINLLSSRFGSSFSNNKLMFYHPKPGTLLQVKLVNYCHAMKSREQIIVTKEHITMHTNLIL